MIAGKTKTEANYRALMLDSSSSLKDFSLDRKKYYRKYVLNEDIEEKDTQALTMGKVVETLLFEPELFDSKFHMSSCASAPTGLMLAFVEALYRQMKTATNEQGVITREFVDIAKDAYVESGFKIKFDAVIAKFEGSDAEIYFKEMMKVRSNGLSVVTAEDVNMAEKIVEELRTNFATADIVNLVNSVNYTIHKQLQVEGYTVDRHMFKSMMDLVIIDHNEKTIQVYDLKCVWAVENFYEEYYLYRRAYIQAYLYWMAVNELRMVNDGELLDYKVLNPKFIVCDSTNYYNPLVYSLSDEDIEDAYKGFEHKGRIYAGVGELIEELTWAMENNVWNISMDNYLSNGQVNLKNN